MSGPMALVSGIAEKISVSPVIMLVLLRLSNCQEALELLIQIYQSMHDSRSVSGTTL
jgi:hypothetical protein